MLEDGTLKRQRSGRMTASEIGPSVVISAFVSGIYLIIRTLAFGVDSPGYSSLMVVLLFMSGLILLCLEVIGEYLSRIFIEIKARPLYIVMETVGLNESQNGD